MSSEISFPVKTSASQILGSLSHIMHKAAAHAKEHEIDEANFLSARLYPDMIEMGRQVPMATDIFRRGAHRLAGIDPQSMEDPAPNFAALAERCDISIAQVEALDDTALNADPDAIVTIPTPRGEMAFPKRDFLHRFMMPNMVFHATTAYALLRMQGVPLGKFDFLNRGEAPF